MNIIQICCEYIESMKDLIGIRNTEQEENARLIELQRREGPRIKWDQTDSPSIEAQLRYPHTSQLLWPDNTICRQCTYNRRKICYCWRIKAMPNPNKGPSYTPKIIRGPGKGKNRRKCKKGTIKNIIPVHEPDPDNVEYYI